MCIMSSTIKISHSHQFINEKKARERDTFEICLDIFVMKKADNKLWIRFLIILLLAKMLHNKRRINIHTHTTYTYLNNE